MSEYDSKITSETKDGVTTVEFRGLGHEGLVFHAIFERPLKQQPKEQENETGDRGKP